MSDWTATLEHAPELRAPVCLLVRSIMLSVEDIAKPSTLSQMSHNMLRPSVARGPHHDGRVTSLLYGAHFYQAACSPLNRVCTAPFEFWLFATLY